MHVRGEESHWTELYLHVRGVILLVDAEYRFTKFTTWAYYLYPNSGYHLHLLYVHMKKHDGLLQFVCIQLFFTFDWNYLSWWHLHLLYIHTYESAPHFSSVCMCQFFLVELWLKPTGWHLNLYIHMNQHHPWFSFVCVHLFLLWLKRTWWHLHLLYIHIYIWISTTLFLFEACLEQQLMLDRYNRNWSISVLYVLVVLFGSSTNMTSYLQQKQ